MKLQEILEKVKERRGIYDQLRRLNPGISAFHEMQTERRRYSEDSSRLTHVFRISKLKYFKYFPNFKVVDFY